MLSSEGIWSRALGVGSRGFSGKGTRGGDDGTMGEESV